MINHSIQQGIHYVDFLFLKRIVSRLIFSCLSLQDYKAAVTNLIDQWAENEERAAHQFLTSSAELDDNRHFVIRRTRKNIVKPVRKAFRALDGTRTEDDLTENEAETPAKEPERVRLDFFNLEFFL